MSFAGRRVTSRLRRDLVCGDSVAPAVSSASRLVSSGRV